jgi:hypothetical protein
MEKTIMQNHSQTNTMARNVYAMAIATLLLGACGGGGGDSSGDGTTSFLSFTESANGAVVKDFANSTFRIRSQDRTITDKDGVVMVGAVYNSDNKVLLNGREVGTIVLEPAANGTVKIAVFKCSDGSGLTWVDNGTTFSLKCETAKAPAAVTQSSGTSGSGGSGQVAAQPNTETTFKTWTGSINGNVILDDDNKKFRARASDGQLVDETGKLMNGAVVNGFNLIISGLQVATIKLVPGTTGNVATFICNDGSDLVFSFSGGNYSYLCRGGTPTNGAAGGTTGGNTGGNTGGSNTGGGNTGGGTTGATPRVDAAVISAQWGNSPSGRSRIYTVTLQNTGNVAIQCLLNFTYTYADNTFAPTTGGRTVTDSRTVSTGYIPVGGTGKASSPVLNGATSFDPNAETTYSLNGYTTRCEKWPF